MPAKKWALQDAKNRLSEVIARAADEGPQVVTRRGEPVAVVVSVETWRLLSGDRPSLKAYLRQPALDGLEVERDRDPGREAELP